MATEQSLNTFISKLPESFPIDKDATMNAFKSMAAFNERFAGIAIDTASRTNEITANTTQESLSRLRELTKVHDDASEYGQAFVNFVQGQMNLTRDTAEAYGKVLGDVREQTAELLSQAGDTAKETAEAEVKTAAKKTTSRAKSAAKAPEKAVEAAEETAEKAEEKAEGENA